MPNDHSEIDSLNRKFDLLTKIIYLSSVDHKFIEGKKEVRIQMCT